MISSPSGKSGEARVERGSCLTALTRLTHPSPQHQNPLPSLGRSLEESGLRSRTGIQLSGLRFDSGDSCRTNVNPSEPG